jgi:hypothetical protein
MPFYSEHLAGAKVTLNLNKIYCSMHQFVIDS